MDGLYEDIAIGNLSFPSISAFNVASTTTIYSDTPYNSPSAGSSFHNLISPHPCERCSRHVSNAEMYCCDCDKWLCLECLISHYENHTLVNAVEFEKDPTKYRQVRFTFHSPQEEWNDDNQEYQSITHQKTERRLGRIPELGTDDVAHTETKTDQVKRVRTGDTSKNDDGDDDGDADGNFDENGENSTNEETETVMKALRCIEESHEAMALATEEVQAAESRRNQAITGIDQLGLSVIEAIENQIRNLCQEAVMSTDSIIEEGEKQHRDHSESAEDISTAVSQVRQIQAMDDGRKKERKLKKAIEDLKAKMSARADVSAITPSSQLYIGPTDASIKSISSIAVEMLGTPGIKNIERYTIVQSDRAVFDSWILPCNEKTGVRFLENSRHRGLFIVSEGGNRRIQVGDKAAVYREVFIMTAAGQTFVLCTTSRNKVWVFQLVAESLLFMHQFVIEGAKHLCGLSVSTTINKLAVVDSAGYINLCETDEIGDRLTGEQINRPTSFGPYPQNQSSVAVSTLPRCDHPPRSKSFGSAMDPANPRKAHQAHNKTKLHIGGSAPSCIAWNSSGDGIFVGDIDGDGASICKLHLGPSNAIETVWRTPVDDVRHIRYMDGYVFVFRACSSVIVLSSKTGTLMGAISCPGHPKGIYRGPNGSLGIVSYVSA